MLTKSLHLAMLASLFALPILAGAEVTAPKTKKVQNIGLVDGVKIVPDKVEVLELRNNTLKERGKVMEETRTWHIKFRQGGDFWPDKEIMIVLNQPIGTGLSGLKVSQKAAKFGTDAYRAQHYPKGQGLAHGVTGAFFGYRKAGKDMIDTIIQNDEIRANLQFSKVTNGKVTIVVDLELPGKRTWLKGKFTGVITKL